jgi:acyl-CoA dehydrogenase
MDEDLAIFRDSVARFVDAEMVPQDEQWRKQQHVGKDIWRRAGEMGLLCTDISAEYGGAGGDFRHEAVLYEETARRGISAKASTVFALTTWPITAPKSRSVASYPAWQAAS